MLPGKADDTGRRRETVSPETLAAHSAILDKVHKAWAASHAREEAMLAAKSFDSRFGSSLSTVRTASVGPDGRLMLNPLHPATFAEARPEEQQIADAVANAVMTVSAPERAHSSGIAMRSGQPAAMTAGDAGNSRVQLASLETDAGSGAGMPQLRQLPDRTLPPAFRPEAVAPAVAPQAKPERAGVEPAGPAGKGSAGEGRKASSVLAYARPDSPADDARGRAASIPWPTRGNRTAVYDITAGVVHMPNGETLEAHSGTGSMRDDPSFAHVKMHGPTPPSTYKLTMREALFHGVEAIRLTPVDGVAPYGRVGLLAHTYLHKVPGDSSGCMAFKDYKRFLAAFRRGEVDRMVVVPRMDGRGPNLASRVAAAFTPSSSR
ncbi:MAG: DUF2778 domain-containing protein [Methylobacterium mesophilicum]|nr:DUF2778 domain-containing protein [Methylobacterium mesophilicum]